MAEKFYCEICVLCFVYNDSEPAPHTIVPTIAFICLPVPVASFPAFLHLTVGRGFCPVRSRNNHSETILSATLFDQ